MNENEGLYTYTTATYMIVSLRPILSEIEVGLKRCYKSIVFQLLTDKPMLCVKEDSIEYPSLYGAVCLIPESNWCDFTPDSVTILINDIFVLSHLGKTIAETTVADLLSVFELLTDVDSLIDFEDEHGLIIGGSRC